MKGEFSSTNDPREAGPKPPFKRQTDQEVPGLDTQMAPQADHGEKTYAGSELLRDRVAVITGADSGIGRAVAIAFAREGADVVISYLKEEEKDAEETARWVQEAGRQAVKIPGDIQSEQHCQAIIDLAHAKFGRLDILVNNAAYQSTHEKIEEFTTEEFDRTFRTNVYATFFLSRAALPKMKPGSVILNTASIQSFDPGGHLLAYAATKAALANFTRSLSELAMRRGVRVNAVAPGPVWTPLIPSTMPKEKYETFGQDSVFGRPAQPAEMAPIYVFLASKYAQYVTGEVYGATGGQMPV